LEYISDYSNISTFRQGISTYQQITTSWRGEYTPQHSNGREALIYKAINKK